MIRGMFNHNQKKEQMIMNNYEAIQNEYAHIGRLTELHFVKNLYTREFYNKKVDEALQRIAELETK